MAIAIFGCVDACGEPVASLTSLPLSLQQLEKFVLRPAGRQRSARPPNISMFPRQLPSVSTSPSAGAPGSSTTGSSSIGFAAVSMQAFGEQLGTPPLASVSHAYCEPSGQDDAPPGSGAHDAQIGRANV